MATRTTTRSRRILAVLFVRVIQFSSSSSLFFTRASRVRASSAAGRSDKADQLQQQQQQPNSVDSSVLLRLVAHSLADWLACSFVQPPALRSANGCRCRTPSIRLTMVLSCVYAGSPLFSLMRCRYDSVRQLSTVAATMATAVSACLLPSPVSLLLWWATVRWETVYRATE